MSHLSIEQFWPLFTMSNYDGQSQKKSPENQAREGDNAGCSDFLKHQVGRRVLKYVPYAIRQDAQVLVSKSHENSLQGSTGLTFPSS